MSVEFTQRVVDALEAEFTASYGAALTSIDATLAGVDQYYKYPVPVIGGDTLHVEFFESEVEFNEPYTDKSSGVNSFEGTYAVRFTLLNRSQLEAGDMVTNIRKYASAALKVVRDNPTLSDACIIDTIADAWSHSWDIDGEEENKKLKLRGMLTLRIKVQENV